MSTLADNATPIASAATLIALERANHHGVDLPVRRLAALGVPVALLTSVLGAALVLAFG